MLDLLAGGVLDDAHMANYQPLELLLLKVAQPPKCCPAVGKGMGHLHQQKPGGCSPPRHGSHANQQAVQPVWQLGCRCMRLSFWSSSQPAPDQLVTDRALMQDSPEAQAILTAAKAEAGEGGAASIQHVGEMAGKSRDSKNGKVGKAKAKAAEAAPAGLNDAQFMDCQVLP